MQTGEYVEMGRTYYANYVKSPMHVSGQVLHADRSTK